MTKGATIQLLGGWAGVFKLDTLFISPRSCLQYFIYFTLYFKQNIYFTSFEFIFLSTKFNPKIKRLSIDVGVKETSETIEALLM